MATARQESILKSLFETSTPCTPCEALHAKVDMGTLFGRDVFSLSTMREHLPKDVFQQLEQTVKHGTRLPANIADVVANAMKDWALEHGASHFTHWFQPMTGVTAEKHDAFMTPLPDGKVINEFSGKTLICGEPDASSFPSGGIRSTFEARGYTAWDPTSPVFVLEGPLGNTLHIPSLFYSYTGEALDRKTPLLRSCEVISRQALRILRLFGNTTARTVKPMVGAEQEYFLIDRRLASLRPDLLLTGRTLCGAPSPKGQELEDHYFGAIPTRVMAFMQDVEFRLFALGIPARTRHNEVAPGQFEMAPLFEEANIATDHNMLIMNMLRYTAEKHGFLCLLHEKPFAGVNGSGKHNNWSLCDSDGNNLLSPGDTPLTNAQFLVFLAAVLRAVHLHAAVLRLGTLGAGNDHRLGANEAPPAILSVYLGDQLTEVLDNLINGPRTSGASATKNTMEVGVSSLPPLPKDLSDRNRTSPFAFTGNKFEFRAVGASQSIAPANIALNAAVACALDDIATSLEASVAENTPLTEAVHDLLVSLFREHMPIVFNGNGYTAEWKEEALRRGLPNLASTVEALEHYSSPAVMDVFLRHGILSERELLARQGILLELYCKSVLIEARVLHRIGRNTILPVAMQAQTNAANAVVAVRCIVKDGKILPEEHAFANIREHTTGLRDALLKLEFLLVEHAQKHDPVGEARMARDVLIPAMDECRRHIDSLEELVDNALWPLPVYAELMWVH